MELNCSLSRAFFQPRLSFIRCLPDSLIVSRTSSLLLHPLRKTVVSTSARTSLSFFGRKFGRPFIRFFFFNAVLEFSERPVFGSFSDSPSCSYLTLPALHELETPGRIPEWLALPTSPPPPIPRSRPRTFDGATAPTAARNRPQSQPQGSQVDHNATDRDNPRRPASPNFRSPGNISQFRRCHSLQFVSELARTN